MSLALAANGCSMRHHHAWHWSPSRHSGSLLCVDGDGHSGQTYGSVPCLHDTNELFWVLYVHGGALQDGMLSNRLAVMT